MHAQLRKAGLSAHTVQCVLGAYIPSEALHEKDQHNIAENLRAAEIRRQSSKHIVEGSAPLANLSTTNPKRKQAVSAPADGMHSKVDAVEPVEGEGGDGNAWIATSDLRAIASLIAAELEANKKLTPRDVED